jgi:hypothetical protein
MCTTIWELLELHFWRGIRNLQSGDDMYLLACIKQATRRQAASPPSVSPDHDHWCSGRGALLVVPYIQFNLAIMYKLFPNPLNSKSLTLALASKEPLTLRTPLAIAPRASQSHLFTASNPTVQMRLCDICQCLDENRRSIQTLRSLDSILVTRLTDDFFIELIQSFNVV